MRVSLNELAVTSQKAALGVGSMTGAAEDLGRAAKWLALRALPAARLIREGLSSVDSSRSVFGSSVVDGSGFEWRSGRDDEILSAVLIGGAAADLFFSFHSNQVDECRLEGLDQPFLQLPHFAERATERGISLTLQWVDSRSELVLNCYGDGISVVKEKGEPMQSGVYRMIAKPSVSELGSDPSKQLCTGTRENLIYEEGYEVDDADWTVVCEFADKILVEASVRSRAMGAGAGLTDND